MNALIVYFSYSGNTRQLVKGIEKELHLPVVEIERETPYSPDYDTCAYKEAKEEWEGRICPKIKKIGLDVSSFDKVFLFYPIWWYTHPMVVESFAKTCLKDYKGEVYLFANSYTNDPSYMKNTLKDLNGLGMGVEFKEGLFNKSLEEHLSFIGKILG